MILFFLKIGLCSVLIYIDDHRIATESDEINEIIEKFQANNKAIHVNTEKKKVLFSFNHHFRSIVEWKLMKFMKILKMKFSNISNAVLAFLFTSNLFMNVQYSEVHIRFS